MKNPFARKPSSAQSRANQPSGNQSFSGQSSSGVMARMPASGPMTNTRLEGLIHEASKEVKGQLGYWQFNINGRDMLVITDETHNRMRIISPVAAQEGVSEGELTRLLEANFGSALDAKYALGDGTLWSVFTHPLAELTDMQFLDCLAQVANLADNFGGSYASSNLMFGGG